LVTAVVKTMHFSASTFQVLQMFTADSQIIFTNLVFNLFRFNSSKLCFDFFATDSQIKKDFLKICESDTSGALPRGSLFLRICGWFIFTLTTAQIL